MIVHTRTNTFDALHFAGITGSGRGYVVTSEYAVVEVVDRGGVWRAVHRVDPSSLPDAAWRVLCGACCGADRALCEAMWDVRQGRRALVRVAFGGGKPGSTLRLPSSLEEAIRIASGLNAPAMRILAVPIYEAMRRAGIGNDWVDAVSIADSYPVVWSR